MPQIQDDKVDTLTLTHPVLGLWEEGHVGRSGEKARMMMSSLQNIGCPLPWAMGGRTRGERHGERGERRQRQGAMMQGTS